MMYVEQKEPIYTMEVSSIRPPTIATGFVMFFAIVSFVAPIIIIAILTSVEGGFKPVFLLSMVVFFAVGYYLFRLASWNYNGKEVIEIYKDEVVYRAITKWLTLSTHTLKTEGCILIRRSSEDELERYLLRNSEQVVEMRFPVSSEKLNHFEEVLEQFN